MTTVLDLKMEKVTAQEQRRYEQYELSLMREFVGTYPYMKHRIMTAIAMLEKHEARIKKIHYDEPVLDLLTTQDLLNLLEDFDHRMERLKKTS